jgi:hypothetical protein
MEGGMWGWLIRLFRKRVSDDPVERQWDLVIDLESRCKAKRAAYYQMRLSWGVMCSFHAEELSEAAEEAVYLETQLHHQEARLKRMLAAKEEEKEFYRKMGLLEP